MTAKGDLSKMRVVYDNPVSYFLDLGNDEIYMNDLITHSIHIEYTGIIHCIACGRTIKKAFGQGFCFPCFQNSPMNSECIIRPELCQGHEGIGRDPEWERKNHDQPHVVYLALTSGVKVGVTRLDQVPTRWIDQGAWKAIEIASTPNRYLAGMIEVNLKKHFTDKTLWQRMLKNEMNESIDLLSEKTSIPNFLPDEFQEYFLTENKNVFEFRYPVSNYPAMVKSHNLEKEHVIDSRLIGIRGQYLYFEDQRVINLRKYSGYEIIIQKP